MKCSAPKPGATPVHVEPSFLSKDQARESNIVRNLGAAALVGAGTASLVSLLHRMRKSVARPRVSMLPYDVTLNLPLANTDDDESAAEKRADDSFGSGLLALGGSMFEGGKDLFQRIMLWNSHRNNPADLSDAGAVPMWGGMGLAGIAGYMALRDLLKEYETGGKSEVDRARSEFRRALETSALSKTSEQRDATTIMRSPDLEVGLDLLETKQAEPVSAMWPVNVALLPALAFLTWMGVNEFEQEKKRRESEVQTAWSQLKGLSSPTYTANAIAPGSRKKPIQMRSLLGGKQADIGLPNIMNAGLNAMAQPVKNWAGSQISGAVESNMPAIEQAVETHVKAWMARPENQQKIQQWISGYMQKPETQRNIQQWVTGYMNAPSELGPVSSPSNAQVLAQSMTPHLENAVNEKFPWLQPLGNTINRVGDVGKQWYAGMQNFGQQQFGIPKSFDPWKMITDIVGETQNSTPGTGTALGPPAPPAAPAPTTT